MKAQSLCGEMIFLIVRHDMKNIGESRSFFWLESRPTTCCNDFIHSGASDMADPAPRFSRSIVCDRAGVDYSHIRQIGRANDLMPSQAELPRHAFNFRLIEPAPNGVEINFHKQFSGF